MFQGQRIDVYENNFCAFPSVFVGRSDVDQGGKVLLPSSMLAEISTMNLVYPLQFEIASYKGTRTHCGVLEFVAPEGQIICPQWMMNVLRIEPQEMVRLRTVVLPKGKLVKLRPEEKAFIELANPKAVLESKLSSYSTLTKGDMISIFYNGRCYTIDIMETKPRQATAAECKAISIVDTELEVDFDRPLDMPASPVRPTAPTGGFGPAPTAAAAHGISFQPVKYAPPSLDDGEKKSGEAEEGPQFHAFEGTGKTLSGKAAKAPAPAPEKKPEEEPAKQDFVPFNSGGHTLSGKAPKPSAPPSEPAPTATAEPEPPAFKPFVGGGRSLSGKPATPSSNASASATAEPPKAPEATPASKFAAFQGKGRSLK